jgi:hypothetical protein
VSEPRRFPPPWSVEETDACFIVRDASGQALAYVYFEDEPGLCRYNALNPKARHHVHGAAEASAAISSRRGRRFFNRHNGWYCPRRNPSSNRRQPLSNGRR